MSLSLRKTCHQSLEFLIRHGFLEPFEPAGPYRPAGFRSAARMRPEEERLLHYAHLRGPLYSDERSWHCAYQLVRSFTRSGIHDSRFHLPQMWVELPVDLEAASQALPAAFAGIGFQPAPGASSAKRALFQSEESCKVYQLPEPYGAWYQHRLQRPKWDQPAALCLRARCSLHSPAIGATRVDIELSAFALPVVVFLGRELSSLLSLPAPLQCTLEYLRGSTQWTLNGTEMDLGRLE